MSVDVEFAVLSELFVGFWEERVVLEHEIGEFYDGSDEMLIFKGLIVFAVEPVFWDAIQVVHFFVEFEQFFEGFDFFSGDDDALGEDAHEVEFGEVVGDDLSEEWADDGEGVLFGLYEHVEQMFFKLFAGVKHV